MAKGARGGIPPNQFGSGKETYGKSAPFAQGAGQIPAKPATTVHPVATGFFSRDNIEQLLVALILALLFRSFEAEAFVIPTGSMASTLVGKHRDIACEQCGHRFQAGDSSEPGDNKGAIASVTCPLCNFETSMEDRRTAHQAWSGDRILVNKYAYEFSDPERWDVIVFKFPGNAKQNYIKRLVGLPQETLRIRQGDIYVRPEGKTEFSIARKPPDKLLAMMQLVHDTQEIPKAFARVGWPSAWFAADSTAAGESNSWKVAPNQNQFSTESTSSLSWLRYRNLLPTRSEWETVREGTLPKSVASRSGELVTDFYAYNATKRMGEGTTPSGWHWVGDLILQSEIEVDSTSGELQLDLVEGGHHFTCRIDVSNGSATVSIDGGKGEFASEREGIIPLELTAKTPLRQPGHYRLRWANADDQLRLWVNDTPIEWTAEGASHSGGYRPDASVIPHWSVSDPADLNPAGIGARGLRCHVNRLQVFRDLYYVATSMKPLNPNEPRFRTIFQFQCEYRPLVAFDQVREIMQSPQVWSTTNLFGLRAEEEFVLGKDQFFPMGDNSPFSSDGRLWERHESATLPRGKLVGNYVERDLLIGKAFLVYWPHGWNLGPIPIPIVPNVSRMERIK